MTKYSKYPVPSDYVSKRQLDKLADKLVVNVEHERRKRIALTDRIRSLEQTLAAFMAVASEEE